MLSTLLNVTGLLIGLTAQEHISSASPIIALRSRALCIAIPNAREDESFADDLNKKRGIVNSRVALLLRSIEIQPAVSKIRALIAHLPPSSLQTSISKFSLVGSVPLDSNRLQAGGCVLSLHLSRRHEYSEMARWRDG